MRKLPITIITAICSLAGAASLQAAMISLNVNSTAMPWNPTQAFFSYGINDGTAPANVSAGFNFAPGGLFTISYLSGLTSPFGGGVYAGPEGDPGYTSNGNPGSTNTLFPSAYMSPYPIFLNALVGTFADSSGNVVGTPFAVGTSVAITAPAGATQLQFGFNDDFFKDNSGSMNIQVEGPDPASTGVPEGGPGLGLLAGGIFLLLGLNLSKGQRKS